MNLTFLNQEIQLENYKVLLTPFTEEKSKELHEIIFDTDIWKYMGIYITTEIQFENYISETIQNQFKNAYTFIITDKTTNKVAGVTSYGNINFKSEKLEIGWTWYGKKFQGTGLNKACKYEMLRYGFESINVRRIQFSADLENLKSQKAIEKLGATKEGVFRNNYIDPNGKSKDDVYYSIIKYEWDKIKETHFGEFV